jgi:uncharacterized protein with von Willebrand factor type A (vWA) domain
MSESRSSDWVRPLEIDLPQLSVAFARRLQAAGVAVPAERPARFAEAMTLVLPESRRRLYFTARAAFVADSTELTAFNRVFAELFGALGEADAERRDENVTAGPSHTDPPSRTSARERSHGLTGGVDRASSAKRSAQPAEEEVPVPTVASEEEQLANQRFDALEPEELAEVRRLIARLAVATPTRLARRARRDNHGRRIDMRRTLRQSMRTGGDPIRLARRRRRPVPRRLVLLCDISGSMEPYARVYLQFLACAAASQPGAGRHEAFAFATRLTRLTRALASRNPDRAIQRAAAAAPDWSSGTRIGQALKTFNDRHGRRGMARGAVVVILSDGWERGDPALVGQEMQRLARLAHRIIWVNPRVASRGFAPQAGGMAAALPYVDALLAGQSLAALGEVVEAIGAGADRPLPGSDWKLAPGTDGMAEAEPWGSATPVTGSSVAMPSGTGASRGHTTPGWSHD